MKACLLPVRRSHAMPLSRKWYGCGYFGTTANCMWNQPLRLKWSGTGLGWRARYENIPGLGSVAARGLRQLGLMPQDSLRQPLQPIQQRLQLSTLLGGGPIYGRCFQSELHIDRFALGLIGPLGVRSMAVSRVVAPGAVGLAAPHHPFEHGAF